MENGKRFLMNELSGWKMWEILWMVVATTGIAGLSLYWGDNFLGILMAVTGVICVVLTGKGKMSCYLFGLVNTILYAMISLKAKYYGEVMLNLIYYVPMQFVGWFMWKKHMNQETNEVKKTRLSLKKEILIFGVAVISIYGYGMLLKLLGGNLPFIDSMSTCLSVIAMILSVKRYMEQWILWIVVDVVTIFMWAVNYINGQTDIATLLMWSIYLINAVIMLAKWLGESKRGPVSEV